MPPKTKTKKDEKQTIILKDDDYSVLNNFRERKELYITHLGELEYQKHVVCQEVDEIDSALTRTMSDIYTKYNLDKSKNYQIDFETKEIIEK